MNNVKTRFIAKQKKTQKAIEENSNIRLSIHIQLNKISKKCKNPKSTPSERKDIKKYLNHKLQEKYAMQKDTIYVNI